MSGIPFLVSKCHVLFLLLILIQNFILEKIYTAYGVRLQKRWIILPTLWSKFFCVTMVLIYTRASGKSKNNVIIPVSDPVGQFLVVFMKGGTKFSWN